MDPLLKDYTVSPTPYTFNTFFLVVLKSAILVIIVHTQRSFNLNHCFTKEVLVTSTIRSVTHNAAFDFFFVDTALVAYLETLQPNSSTVRDLRFPQPKLHHEVYRARLDWPCGRRICSHADEESTTIPQQIQRELAERPD